MTGKTGLTTKGIVHQEINRAAAEIANSDPRLGDFLFSVFPRVQAAAAASMFSPVAGDGLGLQYDEAWLESPYLEDKEGFIEDMRQIAVAAVQQALIEKKHLFVGVIIGEARKGRNYFGGEQPRPSRAEPLFS